VIVAAAGVPGSNSNAHLPFVRVCTSQRQIDSPPVGVTSTRHSADDGLDRPLVTVTLGMPGATESSHGDDGTSAGSL
jgi:hypothetical protein